ncbi:type II toxin-antitoxin system VapC family toxin [Pandoraea communis]|uniref:Ribonuclease VapC n=1 Tax=Pandoraea communis TaxID=2508297 RepID=A0A5E4X9R5_9BURK|nr:type II toxin-antitoxin system VapC family toxin [Pandoraea communis]MDM8358733.1 type II toxin-antitoxin system VapC family toxin [Pandoraea communis]VVE33043.1 ribonuclease [Pandoraea communis]
MILVDTSVWIDHLRAGDATLVQLLNTGRVLAHPYVIGELALGSLKNRDVVISTLRDLPRVAVATDDEVLHFIGEQTLFGLGIGYVDAHLLAATRLTPGAAIWTRDKRLAATAERLSLAAKILH